MLYTPDGANARIYVPLKSGDDPAAWRRELCTLVHHELQHLGHTKVHAQVARSFWWPSMRTFVQKAIEPCVECNLAKGRRQRAHGKYRAVAGGGSSAISWGCDFYGTEHGEVLSIVDRGPRHRLLRARVPQDKEGKRRCSSLPQQHLLRLRRAEEHPL